MAGPGYSHCVPTLPLPLALLKKALGWLPWPVGAVFSIWLVFSIALFFELIKLPPLAPGLAIIVEAPWLLIRIAVAASIVWIVLMWLIWPVRKAYSFLQRRKAD